ncbi:hypothetical protein Clacol_007592 [Clathrus columnatus]|uniref:Uncharacterized protein n=1 Tax=Clathrus columnatus TaxID=1419009 RepID=A0AAV5AKE2_9AGAM|nr:hypothetical protein Clacol_007592 [Clathrus columnatus]
MGSVPPLVDPFARIKFDNSLGALLVGVIVSATLLGLTSLQSYLYYTNFPNDRTPTKVLVGVLWFLDALQIAFISHSAYYYLVTNYGNAPVLLQGEWYKSTYPFNKMEIAVTIVIAVLVQLKECLTRSQGFSHRECSEVIVAIVHAVFLSNTFPPAHCQMHSGTGVAAVVKLFQIKLFSRITEALVRSHASGLLDGTLSVTVTIDAICILTMPHNWIYIDISLNSRKYLRNKESSKYSGSSRQSIVVPSLRMDDLSGSSQKCPSSPFTPTSQLKMEIPIRGMPPGLTTTTSTMVEPGYAI